MGRAIGVEAAFGGSSGKEEDGVGERVEEEEGKDKRVGGEE